MEPSAPFWSLSTKRIKLAVAYDGTDYCGFASQPGLRTIQGTLKEAVRQSTGEETEIYGASRTDAGTHALGQVVHFDSNVNMEPKNWARVLNRYLPADISISVSEEVASNFHCRFCAENRWYRYRIWTGPKDPFATRYVHDYGRALEVDKMERAASLLIGRHDFLAFSEGQDPKVDNTIRRVHSIEFSTYSNEIWIDIVGDAFLKGMMRRLTGFLCEVGRNYRPIEDAEELLHNAQSRTLPVVLPAKGLCLMEVRYSNPPRDFRTASTLA